MKHYLIALTLMFALNAGAAGVQPRHRHHQQTELADTTVHDELEAFSDTTAASLVGTEDTVYHSGMLEDDFKADSWVENFIKNLVGGTIGVGGVIIAILIILALLLCALAPFILVVVIIRYLISRHNNRVALAEKAMETGQPIPDDVKPLAPESADYYRKKGIKNIATGVGLAIMFSIWDAEALVGVGLLIACWGIGQLVIAKTTK